VQVGPIRPRLKAPKFERLKHESDESLLTFCFQFDLRRYTLGAAATAAAADPEMSQRSEGAALFQTSGSLTSASAVGVYTRPLFGST